MKEQKPFILWFTGLPGSGKSTIAKLLEMKLRSMDKRTYWLGGDHIRRGLSKDLGFTNADRIENMRRVAEVAKLMIDSGQIVLVSLISPFAAERRMARELLERCVRFAFYPVELYEIIKPNDNPLYFINNSKH